MSGKAGAKAELMKTKGIKINFKAIMAPRLFQNSPITPHLSMGHLRMAVTRPIFNLIKIPRDQLKSLTCRMSMIPSRN